MTTVVGQATAGRSRPRRENSRARPVVPAPRRSPPAPTSISRDRPSSSCAASASRAEVPPPWRREPRSSGAGGHRRRSPEGTERRSVRELRQELDKTNVRLKLVEEEAAALREKANKLRAAIETHVVLDHVDETKRHLNVVFIGHVDAGKSTTERQILFLSGQVDDRTIQKYEKQAKDKSRESWHMAYIMDTNEEERVKGKTVEVGRAHFQTEHTRFTILDAPGHKSYVPNMISGASQADIGVLVISARKGEFETGYERGQTREHVPLAKTLGVAKLVVVINKMDEPTVKWSKERYDDIKEKMVRFLESSGYNIKKDVQFLPISGLVGTNMKTRMDKSICSWWDGPCLFEALDRIEVPLGDPKDYNAITSENKEETDSRSVFVGNDNSIQSSIKLSDRLMSLSMNFKSINISIPSTKTKKPLREKFFWFLNNADREELIGLKGIKDKQADLIINLREAEPFKEVADLTTNLGLSTKEIEKLVLSLTL